VIAQEEKFNHMHNVMPTKTFLQLKAKQIESIMSWQEFKMKDRDGGMTT